MMTGTIVNTLTIAGGSIIGSLLHRGLKEMYSDALFTAMGLAAAGLGINTIVRYMPKSEYPVLFIVSLAAGLLIGTMLEGLKEVISDGDIVLATNRADVQRCAIESGAACLLLCMNSEISPELLALAKEKECAVIRTDYDTYAAARLISLAAPVRHYMTQEEMVSFHIDTPVEEARKVMSRLRLHYFPILDKDEAYLGIISRRSLLNVHKKKVILVDHNEASQAVDGLDSAKILEIIDHHRIGTLETGNPVFFRNEPVGCTATIVYTMFGEQGIAIPREIAGLLLSAILSDTLLFHSPTCTIIDKAAAKDLAQIAGEDIEEYGRAMFEAGEDLGERTAEDLLYTDYKEFAIGSSNIAVGQGFFVSNRAFSHAAEMMGELFPGVIESTGKDMILYMLTHVPTQSTLLFYTGKEAEEIVNDAFGETAASAAEADLPAIFAGTPGISIVLPGIVSRKQQLIPPLRERLLR